MVFIWKHKTKKSFWLSAPLKPTHEHDGLCLILLIQTTAITDKNLWLWRKTRCVLQKLLRNAALSWLKVTGFSGFEHWRHLRKCERTTPQNISYINNKRSLLNMVPVVSARRRRVHRLTPLWEKSSGKNPKSFFLDSISFFVSFGFLGKCFCVMMWWGDCTRRGNFVLKRL